MWGGWLRWFWHRASFLIHNFGVTPPPPPSPPPPAHPGPRPPPTTRRRWIEIGIIFLPKRNIPAFKWALLQFYFGTLFGGIYIFWIRQMFFLTNKLPALPGPAGAAESARKAATVAATAAAAANNAKQLFRNLRSFDWFLFRWIRNIFPAWFFFRTVNFFLCKWLNFENSISIDWFDAKKNFSRRKKKLFK